MYNSKIKSNEKYNIKKWETFNEKVVKCTTMKTKSFKLCIIFNDKMFQNV